MLGEKKEWYTWLGAKRGQRDAANERDERRETRNGGGGGKECDVQPPGMRLKERWCGDDGSLSPFLLLTRDTFWRPERSGKCAPDSSWMSAAKAEGSQWGGPKTGSCSMKIDSVR